MDALFRLPTAVKRDPAVEAWFDDRQTDLGALARRWFVRLRDSGADVRELIHDGHPTACVDDAAFAYVGAFTRHVNVGFFRGAELPDPAGLLVGTGKRMRHVKLQPGQAIDEAALDALIRSAHADMRARLASQP